MKAPRLSVIVTSYNYAAYIEACLDSIARQSFTDFECVVVDDASSDGSCEKIEHFVAGANAAGRFELKARQQNRGQMAGFRTGLAATEGEFVVFVDADDLLMPDFLETHLQTHLNPHHSVAFTCSDQVQIDAEGVVVSATNPTLLGDRRDPTWAHQLSGRYKWEMNQNRGIELHQETKAPVFLPPISADTGVWRWSATSAMMFRRATLDPILCEECDRFRLYADYYVCMFAQVIGGSLIIPTAHGCYRRHGENAFSGTRVVGSDRTVGDLTGEVLVQPFHDVFVTHLMRNFETFRSVVDEHQLYMAVAKFSSRERLKALGEADHLDRARLLKCRINWRLGALIVWLRSRFFWLRRIVSS